MTAVAHSIAALRPHYFPSILDGVKAVLAREVLLADHLQLPRQSRVTRAEFPAHPQPLKLVVPVHHQLGQRIENTPLDFHEGWPRQHREALRHRFQYAPYFEVYYWDVAKLLQHPSSFLGDWLATLWQYFHQRLFANKPWYRASQLNLTTPAAIQQWMRRQNRTTFVVSVEEVPYYRATFPDNPLVVVQFPGVVAEVDGFRLTGDHPLLMGLFYQGPAFLHYCLERATHELLEVREG